MTTLLFTTNEADVLLASAEETTTFPTNVMHVGRGGSLSFASYSSGSTTEEEVELLVEE